MPQKKMRMKKDPGADFSVQSLPWGGTREVGEGAQSLLWSAVGDFGEGCSSGGVSLSTAIVVLNDMPNLGHWTRY